MTAETALRREICVPVSDLGPVLLSDQLRIVDTITDPAGVEAFCSERLIRLPRCFLSYQPHPEAGPVMPSPAHQSGQATFGSFNRLDKVTPHCIVGTGIARGSRLFLKAGALAELAPRRLSKMPR
jgi:protein O-GlcNAc transferase